MSDGVFTVVMLRLARPLILPDVYYMVSRYGWRSTNSTPHKKLFKQFSECELTFTFAMCYRPSVCRLSVCNVRAPYSVGWNFRQSFFAILYLGHLLTFTEHLRRSSQRNPSVGGFKRKRHSQKSDFWNFEGYISQRCKIFSINHC